VTPILLILSTLVASPSDPLSAGAAGAADVFVCDFEPGSDQGYGGWPDGWVRHRSRELPEFLRIGIVPEEPNPEEIPGRGEAAANRVLEMRLDGGGAVISSPQVAFSPQFSLLLTLRIKTQGLAHDGAWATLSLFDKDGKLLESHASPPLRSANDWQWVRIGPVTPPSARAVRAVVSLHLQPLGRKEDLTGRAWFDDVRIVRLPRMILKPNSAGGIYSRRDAAELVCEVSGIRVRNPQLRFELFDHTGQKLASQSRPLLADDGALNSLGQLPDDGYAGHARWSPPLPDYGFFKVRAILWSDDQPEGLLDRSETLAVLRPLPTPANSEFGWTLPESEQPLGFGPLATLLGQSGLGWAKMPVWYDPRETAKADRIAWFAEQLSLQGIELVGILDQPPDELRQVFREQGKLPVATVFSEPALWQPVVGPVMTRLSLKVHWWQLGDDDDVSFVGYSQIDSKIAEIKRHLEQYGQEIHLGVNWRWIYSLPHSDQRQPPWAYLSYGIDPPLTAAELAAYLAAPELKASESPALPRTPAPRTSAVAPSRAAARTSLSANMPGVSRARRRTGTQRWLLLPPLARDSYATDDRVQDLVLRMLAAKMHSADAVFVPKPFSNDAGLMNDDGSPGELFVPWRTAAMLIGGTDYLGAIHLPGGSTSHVFARGGRAVMVVWSDRPTTEQIFVGDEIEQIDVWGRATRPRQVEADGRTLHELEIGTMPVFVTGLSEAVARWQADLAFESAQLASVSGREQTIVLKLRNTFSQPVGGELLLHAPKSWVVDSRPSRFKLAEGEELRLPLPVTLTNDANSGPQPVRLDFEISAQRSYRFSVYRTLQLGLDDVQVEISTRLRNDGALVVEQRLANQSNKPLSFQCLLFAPGRRRETRQVLNLGQDRTTLTFVLPGGEELLGEKLWLRAEEIGGPRVLNYTLTAER
jgi:hypothetical protein